MATCKFNIKLDYDAKKANLVQISNDAYYFLAYGEPCLDNENMDEVKELKKQYPFGFKINPEIEFVEDSDLIECNIIPICKSSSLFTHYRIMGKWYKEEFYYSSDRQQACYRFYDFLNGRFIEEGWHRVYMNEQNKPEIRPPGCIIPLWGKSWLKY